jgi:hypothetical protein
MVASWLTMPGSWSSVAPTHGSTSNCTASKGAAASAAVVHVAARSGCCAHSGSPPSAATVVTPARCSAVTAERSHAENGPWSAAQGTDR